MTLLRVVIEPREGGRSAVMLNGEVLASGSGAVVCEAARSLIERGHDPRERMEAYRGDTLSLSGRLGVFAKLTVEDGSDGVPRFRPYRPHPLAVSPYKRLNDLPAIWG